MYVIIKVPPNWLSSTRPQPHNTEDHIQNIHCCEKIKSQDHTKPESWQGVSIKNYLLNHLEQISLSD
jgi:hypothetical protein